MKSFLMFALLVPAGASATEAPAPRVTMSDVGGHVIGNPLAKNRLVEYISYTCSHCAEFETNASPVVRRDYVAKGVLTAEVRNLVRDPVDMTAALLARCGGPAKFFDNHRALMSAQTIWLNRVSAVPAAEQKGWYEGAFNVRMQKIARAAGFYTIMQKRGITVKQANVCMSDGAAQKAVLAMTRYAVDTLKIPGTPGFTLNDRLLENL
ncbi:MAG: thioredoxin domain-containing protein [Parasphingorhabdus sp.]|nr:thioredoxin domain-containing protein [Parasphingorhabdus sp.]